MSAEFIHVDQAHDALTDLIKELHEWKSLADRLYYAVCHEQGMRAGNNYQCEQCTLAIEDYKKAADSDES